MAAVTPEAQTQSSRPGTGGARDSESPQLLVPEQMPWGHAPDAFPSGVQLCVLHGDPAAPGELFCVRLKAGQRCVFAPHRHPHDEHVTVISGRVELGAGATLDHRGTRVLEPGGYAFLPKEQFHFAWALSEDTILQVEAIGPFGITYANPEDDPRNATRH